MTDGNRDEEYLKAAVAVLESKTVAVLANPTSLCRKPR